MIETWHEMAENLLHASAAVRRPVTAARLPHQHPEWTHFEATDPSDYPGRSRTRLADRRRPSNRSGVPSIRARKNTSLKVQADRLHLTFSGDDPGIAIDLRGYPLAAGPYELTFTLTGGTLGSGELYFTTDPKTTLPRGKRIEFEVAADGSAHDVRIELPVGGATLHQFRVDVSDGPGEAVIEDLRLNDDGGRPLYRWPAEAERDPKGAK
jgi:arylsulfatase